MRIIGSTGTDRVAVAYIAEVRDGKYVEFVESVQPPLPRRSKWVLIVSTMFGCPVGCPMCDAGGRYAGNLSVDEMLSQIDFMVSRRFPGRRVDVDKFKIQFARMGEPSLNRAVPEVLAALPGLYEADGLMPAVSTVAPVGSEAFFSRLLEVKSKYYRGGRFQLQVSIHTTDMRLRDSLIPARKWGFSEIAQYGKAFYEKGDRKIALNAALVDGAPLDPEVLLRYFDPDYFMVKVTPLNPTYRSKEYGLESGMGPDGNALSSGVITSLRRAGYDVIVSVGELEENLIGSNCGQYLMRHLREKERMSDCYTYDIRYITRPDPAEGPTSVS